MDVTLEQVLVAAKERRAPLTPETAGYIALAIADALMAAPAMVRETDVRVHDDGAVSVVGAQRAAEAGAPERSVRILLGKLLQTSAGSAPALAASARSHGGGGVEALVAELEAALVPVNRAAAKRAIARIAREATRAAEAPKAQAQAQVQAEDPQRSPAPRAPRSEPPRPKAKASLAAPPSLLESASEPASATPAAPAATHKEPVAPAADAEPTQVDAPVEVRPLVTPPPPTPEPPVQDVAAAPAYVALTPKLATYDPSASHGAVAAARAHETIGSVAAPAEGGDLSRPLIIQAPAFGEVVEADIPTPSIAIDVETREESSKPLLDVPSLEVPILEASPAKSASDELARPEAGRTGAQRGEEREAAVASAGPDRVGELLATFGGHQERSSGDVARELKAMVGLPPTPPPPATEQQGHETPGTSAAQLVGSDDEHGGGVMEPVQFERPRAPRSSFAVVVALLVLALGALAAVWYFYPQVFVGH